VLIAFYSLSGHLLQTWTHKEIVAEFMVVCQQDVRGWRVERDSCGRLVHTNYIDKAPLKTNCTPN